MKIKIILIALFCVACITQKNIEFNDSLNNNTHKSIRVLFDFELGTRICSDNSFVIADSMYIHQHKESLFDYSSYINHNDYILIYDKIKNIESIKSDTIDSINVNVVFSMNDTIAERIVLNNDKQFEELKKLDHLHSYKSFIEDVLIRLKREKEAKYGK